MDQKDSQSHNPHKHKIERSWVIESTLHHARELEIEVDSIIQETELSEQNKFKTLLSFHEALINIITHQNKFNPEKKVEVNLNISNNKIEIIIFDFSDPFDYSVIKSRDLENIKPHGLGVYFYSTFTDRVDYFHSKEKGNAIRLIKNIDI